MRGRANVELFPVRAKVTAQDGTVTAHSPALLHITSDDPQRAFLFVENRLGAVELAEEVEVSSLSLAETRREWTVVESEIGVTIECQRGGGCGCGSPLKRFDASSAVAAL